MNSIITLSTASVISQVIGIIVSPVISRIYSPSETGMYTLIYTVISIFSSVVCCKYDMEIVIAKEEKETYRICKFCLLLALIISATVCLGYEAYCFFCLKTVFNSMDRIRILFVFPLLFFAGVSWILQSYNNRLGKYKTIALASVLQVVSQYLCTITIGLFYHSYGGLLYGNFIGSLVGILIQKKYFPLRKVMSSKSRGILVRYINQLIFSTPAVFLASLSYSLLNIFIAKLFGTEELGLYSYSFRMLGLPLAVISANVSKLFIHEASSEHQKFQTMRSSFLKYLPILVFLSVLMVVFVKLFSTKLFTFFFGPEWVMAGLYAAILVPMFGIRFVVTSYSSTLIISNKQWIELVLELCLLIVSIISYFFAKTHGYAITDLLRLINKSYCILYIVYFLIIVYLCVNKRSIIDD